MPVVEGKSEKEAARTGDGSFMEAAARRGIVAENRQIAVISGGSSGIGLACAAELLSRGYRVVLAARSAGRLDAAKAALIARIPAPDPAAITLEPLDVSDIQACGEMVARIERDLGPIDLLLCSAGIAEPGLFLEQPVERHVAQMQTNYFGTLALVHAVSRPMAVRKRGHIVLIASGAAFVGIYGYAAYAPSKFAVRALAETLRAELAEHGVSVSLACPPDTDTPQYAAEQATKPAATKVISAGGGLYSSEPVARKIISEALKGRFMITHGLPLALLRWGHSVYAPFFLRLQQSIARKIARKSS